MRADGEVEAEREDYDRSDFFVTTSNKQLNFSCGLLLRSQ